jgi:uncharacterized membrane protein YcaP (DUF421 family)
MISALAAIPMEDIGIPLIYSLIPILLMLSFQVIISHLTLKSRKARAFICGKPSIIIENGQLVESELRKLRINLNDLLEQLRIKGYYSLDDIEYAIMETTGDLSLLPRSQKRPLNPQDLDISTEYEGLPLPLIIDGHIDIDNLREIDQDENWLYNKLDNHGINDSSQVFFAALDTAGNFICQRKSSIKKKKRKGSL